MCGGAGTRLNRGEKPLFEVGGEPMIDRVLDALAASRADCLHTATSPRTPETTRRLERRDDVNVIETEGSGYVSDLTSAMDTLSLPIITVVADLPLLEAAHVNRTMTAHESGSVTVCVPAALKRQLGVSVDTTLTHDDRELAPTGLNVVGHGDGETIRVTHDERLAVNVNRPTDGAVAERLTRTVPKRENTDGS